MKFVLTNISTKDIFYDNIEDAEVAYTNLKTRNPDISLLVDFENTKCDNENSSLKCIKLADKDDIRRDEIYVISEGCKRTFRNNIKAVKTYMRFAKKNYYPELILNNRRIAAEYINSGKLARKKDWDEA